MITVTVISLGGVPLTRPKSASFDELGGTIGRAEGNLLVLPDPDRLVSRVHVRVMYRDGGHVLIDQGSNPVVLNGKRVAKGREVAIDEGDELEIGGYVLRVRRDAPARPAGDPFAALPDPAPAMRARSGPAALRGIPEDWDPFADEPLPVRRRPANAAPAPARPQGAGRLGLDDKASAPAALVPGLPDAGPGRDDSLDALFGLRSGAVGHPLAGSPLDAPMAAPNMAASHDPLKSLRSAPLASAPTAPDDFADLRRPWAPPPAIDRDPPAAPVSAPPSAASAADGTLANAVLSWDTPEGRSHTVIQPVAKAAVPVRHAGKDGRGDEAGGAGGAGGADALARPAPATADAGIAPLLAAFRDGLDAPQLRLDALTPELMRLAGQLLRESARGTVDLLAARSALKREMRAETTLIATRKNNPLKFSPSVEVALQHLLSPAMPGFMGPAESLRDACDDLRAHQFGLLAGMHAALAGVLERLAPDGIARRLAPPPGLRTLLPAHRKAALWDAFSAHHAHIAAEAADDPHRLLGQAFLEAYEARLAQLGRESE